LDKLNRGTSQLLAVCETYDINEAKIAIGLRVMLPLNPDIGHYIPKVKSCNGINICIMP